MNQPQNTSPKASLTGGETARLTQSHQPTPALTCEVSPVSPSLTTSPTLSLTSLTTLRSETARQETGTAPAPLPDLAREGPQTPATLGDLMEAGR